MFKISNTLLQLKEAISKKKDVQINSRGYWFFKNSLKTWIASFFKNEEERISALAMAFTEALDDLEKYPIQFSVNKKQSIPQICDFKGYLEIGDMLLTQMENYQSNIALKAYYTLLQRVVGLSYRMEKINGGLDKALTEKNSLNYLADLALNWKQQQIVFLDKAMTRKGYQQLRQASAYPEFIKLLFKDSELKNHFFNWILRDKINPDSFIEFPALCQKIMSCSLNGRIGRLGGDTLSIKKKFISLPLQQKILTLPFEGKDLNILDDQKKVTFRGNYTLTIAEIFEVFKNKYKEVGNLEFMAEGIINWNVHRLGWWNEDQQKYHVIDMHKPAWWTQLPVFELLTKKEAELKYGWHLNGLQWSVAASASRGSPTLNLEETHAYLEIGIPKGSHYAIFVFGKFACDFPSSFYETLSIFCKNVHATIAYPDENVFYSHRQHAHHLFEFWPEEGFQLMEKIKEDILLSRGKNFIFQIESENCAKWIHEKIAQTIGEEKVPNLFRIHLLDTEPIGLLAKIFNMIKKLPRGLQIPILTTLHLPLGAYLGTWIRENGRMVRKSLTNHEFWETAVIYLPAYLHKQKEIGALSLVIQTAKNSILYQRKVYLAKHQFNVQAIIHKAICPLSDAFEIPRKQKVLMRL